MSVFNPPHFLRHIGMPPLREFTEAHVLGPYLTLDWTQEEATLPAMVSQAVEALATELPTREMTPEERKAGLSNCRMAPVMREFRRPIAYDVDYVYKGSKFRTRMARDPGNRLRIRVSITPQPAD